MAPDDPKRVGIDQISTRWALIKDPAKFVMRYAPAIRSYLSVFLKNPHDVDDVCQKFFLRVIERGLVEERAVHGRFRDYLIAAVRNAALAHLRGRPLAHSGLVPLGEIPSRDPVEFPSDEEWLSRWRRLLLENVWQSLDSHEREHPGSLAFTVLRLLTDYPQEDSSQLSRRASHLSGRSISPDAYRKQVSRARRLFAEFLVAEVARTLEDPTPINVEEELIDAGLMKYVQPFLPPDWRTRGKLVDGD